MAQAWTIYFVYVFRGIAKRPNTYIQVKSPHYMCEHQLYILGVSLKFGDFLKTRLKLTLIYLMSAGLLCYIGLAGCGP